MNLTSHFCTLKDFKHTDLWSSLAPLMWEIHLCAQQLFCTKFISEQHLFETIFDILRIFGITEPQSESNFPFLYIIKFWTLVLIFLSPLALLMGEIDLCAHGLFCTKFNFEQLLLEAFFDMMRIFGSGESQSESNFPFFLHFKSAQETTDECYEMLLKIFTDLVGYCLLTYFRDEIATVISWICVELVGTGKILKFDFMAYVGISYFSRDFR